MKTYYGKTIEDAIAEACETLMCSKDELIYVIGETKKGVFSKKVSIDVYEIADVISFAEQYLVTAIKEIGIDASTKAVLGENGVIRIVIDSDHNSILIGKNGRTLQSLNELTKLAVSNKFKKRIRVLVDVSDYKDEKYDKIAAIARRVARDVLRSKQVVTLDPMPADERRIVHNTLSGMEHIKTESVGDGRNRQVTIRYID